MLGALLITAALMLGVYTIVKPAAEQGWARRHADLGAVSIALLAAFVVREATARTPLIPLRIFRSRNVSGANAIQALVVAGMFGCSSSARCTCARCSATTRSRSGSRSCRRRS